MTGPKLIIRKESDWPLPKPFENVAPTGPFWVARHEDGDVVRFARADKFQELLNYACDGMHAVWSMRGLLPPRFVGMSRCQPTELEWQRAYRTADELGEYFSEDALHYPVTAYDKYEQYKQEKKYELQRRDERDRQGLR